MTRAQKNAVLILKLGIAFAFLYPAVSAFIDPTLWIGYVPQWVSSIAPREAFLPLFSLSEIALAMSVLFTSRILPPTIAGMTLVAIVVFNPSEFLVVFRDLAIAAAAFALALLHLDK